MSSEHDDQVLIQYLIGSLPEAEAERLDQLSIADDEFVSRLSGAENDLVDAYVRGELSGDTLQRFGIHYLSSRSRRDKVAFANTLRLREMREATRPAEAVAPRPSWRLAAWRFRTVPGPAPAWALAGVAALTLVAAAYLLVANGRLQQELARTQSDRASLQSRARELQRRLVRERPADAGAPKEADGSGRPPATDIVALRLQLETDEFPRYRVALKAAASDRALWRSEKLESTREGDRRVVAIRMPAALLTRRHYSVELTDVTRGGTCTPMNTSIS